jgi:hypothetical protein
VITKINIQVRMVCSNNFATSDSLYDTDSSLKPDYMLEDISKICGNNNFSTHNLNMDMM